jgi:hypothetical protein
VGSRGTARPALTLEGDVGLGITTNRVALVGLAALALVNLGNAAMIASRPWRTPGASQDAWLLLGMESNPSTWLSATFMVAAALACLLLSLTEEPGSSPRTMWRRLALVPLLLSIDEVAELHERLGGLEMGGPIHYSWVVPGAVLVAVLGALFARFVWGQGPAVRNLLVASAGIVVGGGIVLETLNGQLDESQAPAAIYMLSTTVEENLEFLGVLVLVVGLVEIAARRGLRLSVTGTR